MNGLEQRRYRRSCQVADAFAAVALAVAVAAVVAVALLVARDEPARAADEVTDRLPVGTAGFAVCEPAAEPACTPIPMRRRRAAVSLDDHTSVILQTDEGAYEVSVKRVDRPRPRRGNEMYEHRLQNGEAVEIPTEGDWKMVIEGLR